MIRRVEFILVLFLLLAGCQLSNLASVQSDSLVIDIVRQMPAENSATRDMLAAELVKLGPKAVIEICDLLVPTGAGDDSKARYALSGLAHYVSRPGAEAERREFTEAAIEVLQSERYNEVKSFLISQLQLVARDEAVPALEVFLNSEKLCEPAARALLVIQTPNAENAFLEALGSVKAANRVTIIKALGELQSKRAAKKLLRYTANKDMNTRLTALYAVANIADISAAQVLAKAAKEASGYERAKVTSYYLLFARRLAESGDKVKCARICIELIKTRTGDNDENVRLAALNTLAATIGIRDTTVIKDPDVREQLKEYFSTHTVTDPEGFVPLFNGRDLSGWKGLVGDPESRAKMSAEELADAQAEADELMRAYWKVVDGVLVFDGEGESLCTVKDYGDFELLVDWKIEPDGDSGIYLRGSPQVQIWDTSLVDVGAQVGSGGLYNNQENPSTPSVKVDNPVGQWNTFRIIMLDDKVTVYLNDVLVVDDVVMENYWDRNKPIYPTGQIELQSHGSVLYFDNIFIREIAREEVVEILTEQEIAEGFTALFNGLNLTGWTGNLEGYVARDGKIVCLEQVGGNLFTEKEFSDFVLRFEFKLASGANNGLGIRAPLEGDAAYAGIEIQILDDTAEKYKNLKPYQYHGSVYGVISAERGHLKPLGQWNVEEVIAKGPHIIVKLNGTIIVDGDIEQASKPATMDGNEHPGLKRKKGHIGFLGHGDFMEFRSIRIKEL
ncbi:DUF1080 domain-containing protein [Planctomycetota bacterium]